jgi:hypothetical protein
MADSTLTIAARFCGPPTSGNGGYVSGLLAQQLGDCVEVTLRRPPPLDQPLRVETSGAERAQLMHGELLLAEALRVDMKLEVPRAPSLQRASEWSQGYVGFLGHAFPGCFSCGPSRVEGDGLRIFPGRSPDHSMVAAPWVPSASLVDSSGTLPAAITWAALDCSGYFAASHPDFALLGKMGAHIPAPLSADGPYVVIGWPMGREGRKAFAGTAIFDAHGKLRASAKQTWITLT